MLRRRAPCVNGHAASCGTIQPADSKPMSLVFPHTFVPWFRSVAPYIHAYRGKTFVVAMAGEGIAAGKLSAFIQDLAILHAMGIKLVLVHGFRPQVSEQLKAKGHPEHFSHGLRITDEVALDCAQEAVASCASRSKRPSHRACPTRRWPMRRCA